ncbi:hypothetical protein E5676_scaffold163G00690 [Cucumis melo var. makuwa]|uniref:Aminotransferase-like plant mobile domain-containing protein n=1 Tax=Cucumis melo var. makuwa TaxID=1194695 RepID=A0A5D3C3H5_CUCMM|nr:hypothetical protein E5676_scaffold163G00690 [Cucumis melo var. makuwa]
MQLYHDALLIRQLLGMMVYFTERFLSGVRHLVILSDRNQPREDGLSLLVEKPWAGAVADYWPRLDNNSILPRLSVEIPLSEEKSVWVLQSSIHNEAPNSSRALTLGQCLIEVGRNTRLLYNTRLYGAEIASLYTYDRNSDVVRAFCEAWCPSTNTLHTMVDELSISLWDLWSFGGLPIKGDFYEERIPSFKELTFASLDKTKYLPMICNIFFRRITQYYDKPTTRKQKKEPRSKSTQNPDGSKIQAREWSSRESMLFAELAIRDDLKDETYLAAFLSCWLCFFVFPQKRSFLHPGVFRVASLMAACTIYSLAVPVLANIYHGLGLITKASNPIERMDFYFFMHYVHGWLVHYIGTDYPLRTEVRGPKMTNFSDWWTTRHETYFEDNRHHLVSSVIPPSSQPRLLKNRVSNLGGKEIRLVEAIASNLKEEVKEHKNESDSSKSDRHWKRPLKKAKSPLNDQLEGLIELGNDESFTGPHVVYSSFEEVGTSKPPVNKSAEQSLRPSALLEEIR